MNNDIDIVITYVTDTDKEWVNNYTKYKQLEIESGAQKETNKQAFGKERSRDWEFLPYWFRAVEQNCKWVRYIWFVCQQESQVPIWLDRANPKLRIIYHNQFIPKKFLPTFNPMVIKSFLFKIDELADNFIESSDDMFFVKNISDTMFFENNVPIDDPIIHPYDKSEAQNTAFDKIIINKNKFLHKIYNKNYKYYFHHLPLARNKSFEKNFYNKHKKEIDNSLIISKFRHAQNLIWHMYTDAMKFENFEIIKPIYKNSACYHLSGDSFDTNKLDNKDVIVVNDTEFITNFSNLKYLILNWFFNKFPKKSAFELTDTCTETLENAKKAYKPKQQEVKKSIRYKVKTKAKKEENYLYF